MKKLFFALASIALVLSCSIMPSAKAKWLIIGYFDGNNDLDTGELGASWVCDELQQLEKVGSTDDVEVIALYSSLKTGGVAKVYHIEKYETELPDKISSTVLEDWGTKDMSDPKTLSDFIKYAKDKYPAENYMLILMDHGGGWQGVCWDEKNGGGNPLTMSDLKQALTDGGIHFNVIFMAACLMGQAEVAYELRSYGDYMCASQNVMWAKNTVKSEWLQALVDDPKMTSLEVSKKIVDAVYNSGVANKKSVVMSVIDLSKMDTLAYNISELAVNLATQSSEHAAEIFDAKKKTEPDPSVPAFVDLRNFANNILSEPNLSKIELIKTAANGVIASLNSAIVYTKSNTTHPRGGLSIHFPENEKEYQKSEYTKLKFPTDTKWSNFLDAYIAAGGGGGGGSSVQVQGQLIYPNGVDPVHPYAGVILSENDTYDKNDVHLPAALSNLSFTLTVSDIDPKYKYIGFFGWDDVNSDQSMNTNDYWGIYGDDQNTTDVMEYVFYPLDKDTYTNINIYIVWLLTAQEKVNISKE